MNPYRASGVALERRWNTPAPDMPMLNGPLGGLCALPDWESLRAEPVEEIEATQGPDLARVLTREYFAELPRLFFGPDPAPVDTLELRARYAMDGLLTNPMDLVRVTA